jgi:hypothetical protein
MPNPYSIGLRPVKQPCRKDTSLSDPAKGVTEIFVPGFHIPSHEPVWRRSNQVLDCEYGVFPSAVRKPCGYGFQELLCGSSAIVLVEVRAGRVGI